MEKGRPQAQGEYVVRRRVAGQIGLMGQLDELLGIGEKDFSFRF